MPEIVNCPQCQRQLRVPDNLIGQSVKCPTCTTIFTATVGAVMGSGPAAPPPPPAPVQAQPPRYEPPAPQPAQTFDYTQEPGPFDAADEYRERRRQLRPAALSAVVGPATALLVVGIIDLVVYSIMVAVNLMRVATENQGGRGDSLILGMACGCMFAGLRIAYQLVIITGAQKMKRLESYGFAMTAAIMAVIPLFSPCLILGIPFGIWALVAINQQGVKDAFYH